MDVSTLNGQIFTCSSCNKIHFEFNQIGIDFSSKKALTNFHNFLIEIDGKEFEKRNSSTGFTRGIHIPFPDTTIKMLLNANELSELKKLVERFLSTNHLEPCSSNLAAKLSKLSYSNMN